jgi:hypothetical protein
MKNKTPKTAMIFMVTPQEKELIEQRAKDHRI